MKHIAKTLWILVCFGAGILIFLHPTIFTGGRILPGDELDGRLILYLQEHWFRVFQGKTGWLDLEMFYPAPHTLGLSDSFILFGLSHSFFRAIGLDIYGASLANYLFLAVIGFSGFFVLLRWELGISTIVAAWAAGLFLCFAPIASGPFLSHTQILSVWYLPWLTCALLSGCRAVEHQPRKGAAWLLIFAIGLAMVLWNAFYTGWFFIFFLCVLLTLGGVLATFRGFSRQAEAQIEIGLVCNPSPFLGLLRFIKSRWIVLGTVALVFLAALIPFLLTYIPTLQASGGHIYSTSHSQLPILADLFHISRNNWIWGDAMMSWFGRDGHRPETHFGLPFLSAACVFSSILIHFCATRLPDHCVDAIPRKWIGFTLVSVFVCWCLMIRVGDFSLWRLVYETVPGATAVRAPYRFNSVLAIPLLCVFAMGIETTLGWLRSRSGVLRWSGSLGLWSVLAFVFIEQTMISPSFGIEFDKDKIEARLATYSPIPPESESFFVTLPTNHSGEAANLSAQLDAWAIAYRFDVPTLNGFSGIIPAGHRLSSIPGNERPRDYRVAVASWIRQNALDTGIFELDMVTREWKPTQVEDLLGSGIKYQLETRIDGSNQIPPNSLPFEQFKTTGWSGAEEQGTWSIEDTASIVFSLASPVMKGHQLILKIACKAYTPPASPRQRFEVYTNSHLIAEFQCTDADPPDARWFPIDPAVTKSKTQVEISIRCLDAISPSEAGVGGDPRALGMLLQSVVLIQEPIP